MPHADNTGREQGAAYSAEFEAQKFKPGQSGNPAGRPKSARSKLSENFLKDALEAWEVNGKAALEDMATEKPADFAKMIASLVPKEFEADINANIIVPKKIEIVAVFPEGKPRENTGES